MDADDEETDLADVTEVLAAVIIRAVVQSLVLPAKIEAQGATKHYLELHPQHQDASPVNADGERKVDSKGNPVGAPAGMPPEPRLV